MERFVKETTFCRRCLLAESAPSAEKNSGEPDAKKARARESTAIRFFSKTSDRFFLSFSRSRRPLSFLLFFLNSWLVFFHHHAPKWDGFLLKMIVKWWERGRERERELSTIDRQTRRGGSAQQQQQRPCAGNSSRPKTSQSERKRVQDGRVSFRKWVVSLVRTFFRALERARKRARWDALTENWVCAHLQKMFKVSFGQFQSVLWWQSCAQYHDQDLEDILFQFESHLPIYLSHFTSERKVIASYIRTIETEILLRRFKLETWITASHWK